MRRIAIACSKGGVGKTSLCVGLASVLAEQGQKVLLIDCDAQGAATRWLGAERTPGLSRVLSGRGDLADHVQPTPTPNLEVVPASVGLLTLDRSTAGDTDAELRLARALDALEGRWDTVVMDTPPTLGFAVTSALAAATDLVVPVEAKPLGLDAAGDVIGMAKRIRARLNPELSEPRVVVSRTTRTRVSREVESQVRERWGWRVLETGMPERVSITRASGLHLPVIAHEPGGPAARSLRALATELILRDLSAPPPAL